MANYKTSDLAIASYLSVHGFTIKDLDKSNPKRTDFIFDDSEKLREYIGYFYSCDKKGHVSPQDYFAAIRNTKNRLYNT